jgi:hypothetical protein
MKKLLFTAGLLALLVACSKGDENIIEFEMATSDKSISLTKDENAPRCQVHLELAYATEKNGHKAEIINNAIQQRLLDMEDLPMQAATDSFANMYTNNYKTNYLPMYNKDRADTTKYAWYEYHYIIKTDVFGGFKGTTVYNIILDYYEGGAHGINQRLTMNFENETGRTLSLADVFVPGFQMQLSKILQEALQEKVGVNNLRELHNRGYLYSMEMFPSENFILAEETITFIYNPYEIAPYSEGSIELIISLSDLKDLLQEPFK